MKLCFQVATSVSSSMMDITGILWEPSNNNNTKVQTYDELKPKSSKKYNYPERLKPNQLNQINKVYSTCIHPTQYLPQQFCAENTHLILKSGQHASEVLLPVKQYHTSGPNSISQFSRHQMCPEGMTSYFLITFSNYKFKEINCGQLWSGIITLRQLPTLTTCNVHYMLHILSLQEQCH